MQRMAMISRQNLKKVLISATDENFFQRFPHIKTIAVRDGEITFTKIDEVPVYRSWLDPRRRLRVQICLHQEQFLDALNSAPESARWPIWILPTVVGQDCHVWAKDQLPSTAAQTCECGGRQQRSSKLGLRLTGLPRRPVLLRHGARDCEQVARTGDAHELRWPAGRDEAAVGGSQDGTTAGHGARRHVDESAARREPTPHVSFASKRPRMPDMRRNPDSVSVSTVCSMRARFGS